MAKSWVFLLSSRRYHVNISKKLSIIRCTAQCTNILLSSCTLCYYSAASQIDSQYRSWVLFNLYTYSSFFRKRLLQPSQGRPSPHLTKILKGCNIASRRYTKYQQQPSQRNISSATISQKLDRKQQKYVVYLRAPHAFRWISGISWVSKATNGAIPPNCLVLALTGSSI